MRTKRNAFTIILSLVTAMIVSFALAASVYAEDKNLSEEISYQDLFYYQLRESGLHITRAVKDKHYNENGDLNFEDKCKITSLHIPDTLPVNGTSYPVEYIDGTIGFVEGAFANCENLQDLVLPSHLKDLGSQAFAGCISLTEVTLPDSLEVLGCGAFMNCKALTSINIPANVRCGPYAGASSYPGPFDGAENLTTVRLSSGMDRIDSAMFMNSGISEIVIPDSVTTICGQAFRNTKKLRRVSFSDHSSLNKIENYAFAGSGLTSFHFPDSTKYVCVGSFADCSDLEQIHLSKELEVYDFQLNGSDGTGAFRNCSALANIEFAEGAEKVGKGLFNNSSIEEITIPSSVKRIEQGAFRDCQSLRSMEFEDNASLETIGDHAFSGDRSLREISLPDGLETIDEYAFEITGLEEIRLPSSLKTMNAAAFYNCPDLSYAWIPKSMTYHGDGTFQGMGAFEKSNALKKVEFEKGTTKIDNYLLAWTDGLEEFTVPSGIETIGYYAFRMDLNLTEITFPKSLKRIESGALSRCSSLKTLTFKGDRPTVNSPICDNEVTADVLFTTWDKIPDDWGGTLTFIGNIGRNITEEMLYTGGYHAYLNNQTFMNLDNQFWDAMADGMNARTDWEQFASKLKYNMSKGPQAPVVDIINNEYLWDIDTGLSKYETELQRDMALDLMESILKESDDLSKFVKDLDKLNKTMETVTKLLGDEDTAYTMRQIAEKLASCSDSISASQIMNVFRYINIHHETFDKANKVFGALGETISVADATVTAFLITEINHEAISSLMDLLPEDSLLWKGLYKLDRQKLRGFERTAVEELISSEVTKSLVKQMTKEGTKTLSGIVVKYVFRQEAVGSLDAPVLIGELFWKIAAAHVPDPTADEVIKAERAIATASTLSTAIRSYRTAVIKRNYETNGTLTYKEMKKNYQLLFAAYRASMIYAAEKTDKCIMDEYYNAQVKSGLKQFKKQFSYKHYIRSCLENANAAYRTRSAANGGVTIVGYNVPGGSTSPRRSASPALRASSAEEDAEDEGELLYIDIPEEINGKPVVGIDPEAFSGAEEIYAVTVPDSVKTIGDNAFRGCAALNTVFFGNGVTSIGSGAFAECGNFLEADLPDQLESIESDAFDTSADLVIRGAEGLQAQAFADANGVQFESRNKKLVSAEIKQLPDRTTYGLNEPIDSTGLILSVTYADGTTEDLHDGISCFVDDPKVGECTAIAIYQNVSAAFPVTITDAEREYIVYYEDEDGNDLRDPFSGTAAGGSTVICEAPEIGGYEPDAPSKEIVAGEKRFISFTYHKPQTGIDIEKARIELAGLDDDDPAVPASGDPIKPRVNVYYKDSLLTEGTDYELLYGPNIEKEGFIEINGIGNYYGSNYVSFRIISGPFYSFVYLYRDSFIYSGKPQMPDYDIAFSSDDFLFTGLKAGEDYRVSWETDCTSIGEHRGEATFLGIYQNVEPAQISFTISPARAVIASAKAGKKKVTIKIKAQKGNVKYRIAIRPKSSKKWKYYTVSKAAKTIKKLKSRKTYQIKAQAFKIVDDCTYEGQWSKVKTIKIK